MALADLHKTPRYKLTIKTIEQLTNETSHTPNQNGKRNAPDTGTPKPVTKRPNQTTKTEQKNTTNTTEKPLYHGTKRLRGKQTLPDPPSQGAGPRINHEKLGTKKRRTTRITSTQAEQDPGTPGPTRQAAAWINLGPRDSIEQHLSKYIPVNATTVLAQDHIEIKTAIKQGNTVIRPRQRVIWLVGVHNEKRDETKHQIQIKNNKLTCQNCNKTGEKINYTKALFYMNQQCWKNNKQLEKKALVEKRLDKFQEGICKRYQQYNTEQMEKYKNQKKPWTHAVQVQISKELTH